MTRVSIICISITVRTWHKHPASIWRRYLWKERPTLPLGGRDAAAGAVLCYRMDLKSECTSWLTKTKGAKSSLWWWWFRSFGKTAINLRKMKLFRQFYIVIVCYIYFTRTIVYLLKNHRRIPVRQVERDVQRNCHFVLIRYKFCPVSQNPGLTEDISNVTNRPQPLAVKNKTNKKFEKASVSSASVSKKKSEARNICDTQRHRKLRGAYFWEGKRKFVVVHGGHFIVLCNITCVPKPPSNRTWAVYLISLRYRRTNVEPKSSTNRTPSLWRNGSPLKNTASSPNTSKELDVTKLLLPNGSKFRVFQESTGNNTYEENCKNWKRKIENNLRVHRVPTLTIFFNMGWKHQNMDIVVAYRQESLTWNNDFFRFLTICSTSIRRKSSNVPSPVRIIWEQSWLLLINGIFARKVNATTSVLMKQQCRSKYSFLTDPQMENLHGNRSVAFL